MVINESKLVKNWKEMVGKIIPLNIETNDSLTIDRVAPTEEEIELEDYLIKKLRQGKIG